MKRCPACGSTPHVTGKGQASCKACGLTAPVAKFESPDDTLPGRSSPGRRQSDKVVPKPKADRSGRRRRGTAR